MLMLCTVGRGVDLSSLRISARWKPADRVVLFRSPVTMMENNLATAKAARCGRTLERES